MESSHNSTIRLTADPLGKAAHERAIGAIIGSAVGDALGAPFEFMESGRFSRFFPEPLHGPMTEMVGGGAFNWGAGEFTDDTQMALLLGLSLVQHDGYNADDVFARWREWAASARDVGSTTAQALAFDDWRDVSFSDPERAAGNGAIMRAAMLAVALIGESEDLIVDVCHHQARLTHHHPDAGWATWLVVKLVHAAIADESLESAAASLLTELPPACRVRFEGLCDEAWTPEQRVESNGSIWGCLLDAFWSVRTTSTFEEALVRAIDIGGDTDTVAAVAGMIAGARYGIQSVPARWTTTLHGYVSVNGSRKRFNSGDLVELGRALCGKLSGGSTWDDDPAGPAEVAPGIYAANRAGARTAESDLAVISLCETGPEFAERDHRLQVYLIDKPAPHNLDLMQAVGDAVAAMRAYRAAGFGVVVHCHGGHSRTGLVLKAWYMAEHQCSEREAHDWLNRAWPLYETWNHDFVEFLQDKWEDVVVVEQRS